MYDNASHTAKEKTMVKKNGEKAPPPSIQNELAQERRDCVDRIKLLDEILAAMEANPEVAITLGKIRSLDYDADEY